jgi:hypothetical protein
MKDSLRGFVTPLLVVVFLLLVVCAGAFFLSHRHIPALPSTVASSTHALQAGQYVDNNDTTARGASERSLAGNSTQFALSNTGTSLPFAWLPLSAGSVAQLGFSIQDGEVRLSFGENSGMKPITIADADPATFMAAVFPNSNPDMAMESTTTPYAKDKNHVYYLELGYGAVAELPSADPATFTIISDGLFQDEFIPSGESYAKDKNAVYINDKLIPGSDPGSFQILTDSYGLHSGFSKDKNGVYFVLPAGYSGNYDPVIDPSLTVMTTADPNTFHLSSDVISPSGTTGTIPPSYAKDRNNVYFGTTTAMGADPRSYVAYCGDTGAIGKYDYLTCPYAKDKTHAFGFNDNSAEAISLISNADPSTFKVLNLSGISTGYIVYAEDAYNVYYGSHIISGADRATFSVVEYPDDASVYDAQDKDHEYLDGKIVQ